MLHSDHNMYCTSKTLPVVWISMDFYQDRCGRGTWICPSNSCRSSAKPTSRETHSKSCCEERGRFTVADSSSKNMQPLFVSSTFCNVRLLHRVGLLKHSNSVMCDNSQPALLFSDSQLAKHIRFSIRGWNSCWLTRMEMICACGPCGSTAKADPKIRGQNKLIEINDISNHPRITT